MTEQNNFDSRKFAEQLTKSTSFLHSEEYNQFFDTYRQMTERLYDAVRNMYESSGMQIMRSLSEQMQAFAKNLPKIEISSFPEIKISEETRENIKRIRYLKFFENVEWPLFLLIDAELMTLLVPYIDEKDPDMDKLNTEILGFLSEDYIKKLCGKWKAYSVISEQRMPLLEEAQQLFLKGYYFGCVTLLTCQLEGLISDFYNLQKKAEQEISEEYLKSVYEHCNPDKVYKGNLKMDREKNQLLAMATLVDSGIFYWIAVVNYLYKIVLTSDEHMEQSNHPCRNKICHGIQVNYGTREHAVKAILITDMTIKFGENIKRIINKSI